MVFFGYECQNCHEVFLVPDWVEDEAALAVSLRHDGCTWGLSMGASKDFPITDHDYVASGCGDPDVDCVECKEREHSTSRLLPPVRAMSPSTKSSPGKRIFSTKPEKPRLFRRRHQSSHLQRPEVSL